MAYLIGFVINVCVAVWIHYDAKHLRTKGVAVIPGVWSTLVFFGSLFFALIYLLVRIISYGPKSKMGLQPLPPAPGWTNYLALILCALVFGGILLMLMVFSSLSRANNQNHYIAPSTGNNSVLSTTTISTSQSTPVSQAYQSGSSNSEDAQTKNLLAIFREPAQSYYNNYHSYSGGPYKGGVCNPAYLPAGLDTSSLVCKSDPTSFALTAPLAGGGFYCVDSSGYVGPASALNTGTSCIQ